MTTTTDRLDELRRHIDAALDRYLDDALPRLDEMGPALRPLTAELRAFTSSGKRLRPAFVLVAYEAAGGDDENAVMGAALALELLHTCALLHDDIIDRADTRRGRPATHRAFADRHATEGWHGDAETYGVAVAILLGDLAFVQADELLLGCEVPPERLLTAFRVFTTLREEVMAGQYLDVAAATTGEESRDTALAVATFKSGRYTVTRPLELGAVLAGADETMLAGIRAFGDPLGRAFQVRDDILGVFGATDATGKSDASDLVEGKRTLLVAETLARLDPPEHDEFRSLLGRADLTSAQADRLRDLIRSSGGLEASRAFVDLSIEEALRVLDGLDIEPAAASTLRELAEFLGARQV